MAPLRIGIGLGLTTVQAPVEAIVPPPASTVGQPVGLLFLLTKAT